MQPASPRRIPPPAQAGGSSYPSTSWAVVSSIRRRSQVMRTNTFIFLFCLWLFSWTLSLLLVTERDQMSSLQLSSLWSFGNKDLGHLSVHFHALLFSSSIHLSLSCHPLQTTNFLTVNIRLSPLIFPYVLSLLVLLTTAFPLSCLSVITYTPANMIVGAFLSVLFVSREFVCLFLDSRSRIFK